MAHDESNPALLAAATEYRAAGLCALPAIRAEKRPAVGSWKPYQTRLPSEAELSGWFANGRDAVCLLCGQASGNLEAIDFDAGGELFSAWWERVPVALRDRLVVEITQSGGRHVIYRCGAEVCGNLKLAQRKDGDAILTLIETRGEGGLFLCAPTAGYEVIQGDLRDPPVLSETERDILLQQAWELNEYMPPAINGPPARPPAEVDRIGAGRPGDDFNERGDLRGLLVRHGWTCVRGGENEYWRRPGKPSGWSATLKDRVFYVFSSNAGPFEPQRAYSPFSAYALLDHGGDYELAARSLREIGYGGDGVGDGSTDVDISTLVANLVAPPSECGPAVADPGPIPEHLFQVPGFIEQVMAFTLANAPYPNVALAFCGAMALQSFLAGRKVCTPGDLRSNIYLLALASSGTGKEFPRKVNSRVLFEVGLVGALGDKFASGEGIQDALVRSGAMLFQNDEMDGVLRQINLDRDNRRESIPNILLTLYTSANDVYPIRVKAGQKEAIHIDQPHLTLFGTATPQYFYESLSQRMLANGFFARMIVIDVGKRGAGQTPGSARDVPESIVATARWWAEYRPGTGNLEDFHPQPRVVPFEPEAAEAVGQLQAMAEAEYDRAEEAKDEVARTAWSRTCENAKKLALIYASSENREDPVIGLPAVEWATAFAMHQTRRQLYLADTYVAENPFHAECLKLLRKLREAGGRMARRQLMRAMRCKAADFDQITSTLLQQGDIVPVEIPTKTKPAQGYQIP
jgi:hypothetical protein